MTHTGLEDAVVMPLDDRRLDDAAELMTHNYRLLRGLVPELPERYEDAASVLPMIRNAAERNPGVVALPPHLLHTDARHGLNPRQRCAGGRMTFSTKRTQYFSAASGAGPAIIAMPSTAPHGMRTFTMDPSGKVTGTASSR